jgi:guanylate kinase
MSSKQEELQQPDVVAPDEPICGILFVVSSPSGGGKGTLVQRVLNQGNLSYSVSYTTRAPRSGEVEGREYFFVTREEFEAMVKAGEFLEWAAVHGKLYGTSRDQVARALREGQDIILEVDVQGAASVRELVRDSVSIFILPPSAKILRQRLIARGTDSAEELELRLRNAPVELEHYRAFDYVIINDEVERAAGQLGCIIEAERAGRERQEPEIKRVVESFLKSELPVP